MRDEEEETFSHFAVFSASFLGSRQAQTAAVCGTVLVGLCKIFVGVDLFAPLNDRGAGIYVYWWCIPRAFIQAQTACAHKGIPLRFFVLVVLGSLCSP